MSGKVWFGTRAHMQWVKAPAIDYDNSDVGFSNTTQFLNGGAAVRGSVAAHREVTLSWNLLDLAESQRILNYARGVYGQGFIHWADPFAMQVNALPTAWAFPALGALDGPHFSGTNKRPTLSPAVAGSFNYPTQAAQYTLETFSGNRPSIWLPIPPGYRAHVGVFGSKSGTATVQAVPSVGTGDGTPVTLTMLSTAGNARSNYVTPVGTPGVSLRLFGVGNLTLQAMSVVILPEGDPAPVGEYMGGQGHSGMRLESQPQVSNYSSALGKQGLSMKFIEVESWLSN